MLIERKKGDVRSALQKEVRGKRDTRSHESANCRGIVVVAIERSRMVDWWILVTFVVGCRGELLVVSISFLVFGQFLQREKRVHSASLPADITASREERRTCRFAILLPASLAALALSFLSFSLSAANRSSSSRSCRSSSSNFVLISCSITQPGSSFIASEEATFSRIEASRFRRFRILASRR
jgi:hypothetical protein